MQENEMKSEGHSGAHEHGAGGSRLKLGVALIGASYVLVSMIFSVVVSLPEWPTLLIATVIQFWAGSEFYSMAWQALKRGSSNMYTLIVLGTTTAYAYSVAVYFFGARLQEMGISSDSYFDASIFVITFILIGNFVEAFSKARASDAIKTLLNLQPHVALVKKPNAEDRWQETSVDDLALGDILLVKEGDRIPTDGIILLGSSSIDESMITGESIPAAKQKGDAVIGATINRTGTIEVEVTKIGEHTVLSGIIQLVEQAQSSRAPVQKLVDTIASYFVPLVIVLSLITLTAWFFLGPPPQLGHAIVSMILVLIIACPCALGLATPLSVVISIGQGALQGVLIKNAQAIEQIGTVTAVVFDKTGTLTMGKLEIEQLKVVPHIDTILTDQGWSWGESGEQFVMALGAVLEEQSSHPLAEAYVRFVGQQVPNYRALVQSVTLEKSSSIEGLGFEANINGHTVIVGSHDVMVQRKVPIDASSMKQAEVWFDEGKSVSFFSIDQQLVAYFSLSDTIRPEAASTIAWLAKHGITTIMLTGDNVRIAKAVSARVGIDEYFASVRPDQKVQKVQELKDAGYVVAMVGDGINDAPALASADVGIAIGAGTDVAIETAQVILLSNDLSRVPFLFQLSRATMRNIYQNLIWAFGYNAVLVPVAMGLLYPFFGIVLNPILAGAAMVFSSLSVVFNSLRLRYMNIQVGLPKGQKEKI